MIRYDVGLGRLQALVDQHKSGWRMRATKRTKIFRKKGRYEEKSSIWGEIKDVFIGLQGEAKCCFCERKFDGEYSQYELDLEHFRPKRRVKEWQCPSGLLSQGVSLTSPAAKNDGYYLLSYHLLNYAVACKPCNSGLKKDYFPISGSYKFDETNPEKMKTERPWLLYPIGHLDVDPEDVLSFNGILPYSHAADPRLRLRGLVTIVFFGLDDVVARKNLMRERAMVVVLLHQWLLKASKGDMKAAAQASEMVASTAMHANCARSFERLFQANPVQAGKVAEGVDQFLQSIS